MIGQVFLWGTLYALPLFIRSDFLLTIFIFTFIYGILAVTFDLIFGFTGQLSMFHPAVFGVSAYMTYLLATHYKLPFWVATLPSAVAAVVLAVIVGSICFKFRLKTFYFAVVTLAFAEMIRLVVMNWNSVTNGTLGLVVAGKPTIYLAGDSTVQTYGAAQAPQQGWGQRIAEFFTNDVTFVNKAIGGRSSKSYIDEGRLDEIVGLLQPGDYLFAQWGINDRYRSDPARFTDPSTTFKDYLNMYIDAARSKNAIPVLVTPTPRLDFSNGAFQNGFVGYCAAIKEVGAATDTRVIDLQTKGLAYYTSIGLDAVVANVSLPPMDVLHFQANGAFQMARLVAEGVKESDLPIAKFVK